MPSEPTTPPALTVSQFLDVCNDLLAVNLEVIAVEGEVAEYKVNQGKWVFFSLKDADSTVNCFMPVWKLTTEVTDGMKVRVRGLPKITKRGAFSFTVEKIAPVGEGNIKKAFELLKKKLSAEGLFDPARKRPLPENPVKIGVISSTGAAGYADFCKIINARWGGLDIQTCHTQVQGLDAPNQIIRALKYLNEQAEVEVIAIIRGGGSKDDLSCFNDEQLAREIARSRIPVITGIGHEIDESLADLVADARASTPSNCAEMLSRDRQTEINNVQKKRLHIRSRLLTALSEVYQRSQSDFNSISTKLHSAVSELERHRSDQIRRIQSRLQNSINEYETKSHNTLRELKRFIHQQIDQLEQKLASQLKVLNSCNPETILSQGYAILSGKISPGEKLTITTKNHQINATINQINSRNK